MPKPTAPCADCGRTTHGLRCRPCDTAARQRPEQECTTAGCPGTANSKHEARCKACVQWSARHAGADPAARLMPRPPSSPRQCEVIEDGARCSQPQHGGGLCGMHWQRKRHRGGPLVTLNRPKGRLQADLRSAAAATTDECVFLAGYRQRPVVPYAGRSMKASRAVWIIANGDPGDRHVLHSCNGGSGEHGCVNIRHLYLGSPAQNVRDKVAAGRQKRGEGVPNAILTAQQVREIRARYAAGGVRHVDLATEYGVEPTTVAHVIKRETWAWLE